MFKYFFYRAVYETMWKNVARPDRPQVTIQQGPFTVHAGILRLQTHTHNMQYFIAFPRQQHLHERASVLRYTYV
jgi:hypothetical protein